MEKTSNWNATAFFKYLTEHNCLAKQKGFVFCRVTGLQGFEEALGHMQSAKAVVAVDEVAQGFTQLENTPHTRRIKTVFFGMRHAIDNMEARQRCMEVMRELFRQYMSVLCQERTRIEQHNIYIDPRVSFQEIDSYFFSGMACAYFQVSTDVYTSLSYDAGEWDEDIMYDRIFNKHFSYQFA